MDSLGGAAAFLEGTEIVNSARTTAYLKAGFGPPNLKVVGDCGCPEDQLRELIGCDVLPYTTPTDDLAPWFDPAFPESADFAGFYPHTFEGLESTYTRDVTEIVTGGAVLGRLRAGPRTLLWRGWLFGRTCCSVAYGLRWLTSTLRQAKCGAECGGEKLDLLVCCPPESVSDVAADCGCGDLDPVGIPLDDDAFRTLYNVGLVEGPLIKGERRSSCRAGCGCSNIMEIEWSMVAGNPHMYRQPVLVADCELFPISSDSQLVKLAPGEECIDSTTADWFVKSTDPADCPPEAVCDTEIPAFSDPLCPRPQLPVITTVVDDCVCDPLAPVDIMVPVAVTDYGMNFQGAPIFSIFSGSVALRSTTIKIYENPLGSGCADIVSDPCAFCSDITIRYLPAFSTLTIDSVNRRITIERPGGDLQSGEQFLVGNITWPLFECIGYCVVASVDGSTAAADACFSMSVYPMEM